MGKCFIVAGAHLGHTTIIAKALHQAGVFMGPINKMIEQDAKHPDGHFELRHVVRINNAILAGAGGSWMEPPTRGAIRKVADKFDDDIRAVVEGFAGSPMWGLKDPRFAHTFPVWRPHLPSDTTLICSFRATDHVVESLKERDHVEDWLAERIVDDYHSAMCVIGALQ